MSEIKLGSRELQYIAFFERITGVPVKDCIAFDEEDLVVFIIEGPVRAAIGRDGNKIRTIRDRLKKNVRVISYSDYPEVFLKNVFSKYGVRQVVIKEEKGIKRAYVYVDPTKKPGAVGKGGKNVKIAKKIVRRHFDVDDVYVVRFPFSCFSLNGEVINGDQISIYELSKEH